MTFEGSYYSPWSRDVKYLRLSGNIVGAHFYLIPVSEHDDYGRTSFNINIQFTLAIPGSAIQRLQLLGLIADSDEVDFGTAGLRCNEPRSS